MKNLLIAIIFSTTRFIFCFQLRKIFYFYRMQRCSQMWRCIFFDSFKPNDHE